MTLPFRTILLLLFTLFSVNADTFTHTNDGPFREVPSLLQKAGITLAPGVETAQRSFFVPGQEGQDTELTFTYSKEVTGFQAEFGFFPMSAVENVDPDAWKAPAMAAKTIVFEVWKNAPGTEKRFTVPAGTEIGFYIIPNQGGQIVARQAVDLVPLFSEPNANPGDFDQFLSFIGNGATLFTWEDLRRDGRGSMGASDEDFGDIGFTIDAEFVPEPPLGYDDFLAQEGVEEVPVENASFESPGEGKLEDQWFQVRPWRWTGSTGCGVDDIQESPDGSYSAYLTKGCKISQNVAVPIKSGYYALSFDARKADGDGALLANLNRNGRDELETIEATLAETFTSYSIVVLVLPHKASDNGFFELAFDNTGADGSTIHLDNIRFQRADRTMFSGPAPPTAITPEVLSFSEVQLKWDPIVDPQVVSLVIEREDPANRFGGATWTRLVELPRDATGWLDLGVNHEGSVRYRIGASDEGRFDWNYSPALEVSLPDPVLPSYAWEVVQDRSLAQADLEGIAYGNGVYVAVGRQATDGYVQTSEDGIIWTPVPHENVPAQSLNRIIFDGNRFVAIDQIGRLGISPDGRTWTFGEIFHQVGTATFLASMGDVVIAGSNSLFVSTDGGQWEFVRIDGAFQFQSLVVFKDQFVTVTNTGAIYTSTDGKEWALAREDQGGNNFSQRTLFVIDDKIWESTQSGLANSNDLQTWTPLLVPVGTQVLQKVFVVGGKRIFTSRIAAVITSDDGVNFEGPTNIEGISLGNAAGDVGPAGLLVLDVNRNMHRTTDGQTWELVRPRSESFARMGGFAVDDVTNTLLAAVGTRIYRRDLDAADDDWQEVWDVPVTAANLGAPPIAHIENISGTFVAVGQQGLIATSADGTAWGERHRSSFGQNLSLISELNGNVVTTGAGIMLQSKDGMQTWESVEFNGGFSAIPFLETGFDQIVSARLNTMGPPRTTFVHSADGESWQDAANFPNETVFTVTAAFGEANGRSRFVARGGNHYVSADGKTWSKSPTGQPLGQERLFYNDGNWARIILNNNNANTLWASPNGLHFVENETDIINGTHVKSATYSGGRYFLYGNAGEPFYIATLRKTGDGPDPEPEDAYTTWVKAETGLENVDDEKYAKGGDIDADGLFNYVEFVVGLSLLTPEPDALAGIIDNVYIGGPTFNLTAEFTMRAGITPLPIAEICNDLTFENCDTSQGVEIGEAEDGFVTVRFRDVLPASDSEQRYLRIKFQVP